MRRILLVTTLFAAGCATTPPQQPQPQAAPVTSQPQVRGELLGLTASELVQRFGNPALQIREGQGLKLQFRGSMCVVDAYLYPPRDRSGPERVAHVDARLRSGADTDPRTCAATLLRT